jgi:hypothetical protein
MFSSHYRLAATVLLTSMLGLTAASGALARTNELPLELTPWTTEDLKAGGIKFANTGVIPCDGGR